jgi:hypothetical protein
MRSIGSAVLVGSVLTVLVCVAFVTVIATGAAIPAPASVRYVSTEHTTADLGLYRIQRY